MSNQSVHWRRAALAVAVASFVVGTAAVRAEDTEKPWERSAAVGMTYTTGNSDTLLFTGALKGQKIWATDELRLALTGAYGKDNNHEVNNETLDGNAQYNHLFTEHLYSAVLVDVLHDGIAALTYRLTVGPSAGYYIIKNDKTKFSGEVGGAYVQEKHESVRLSDGPPVVSANDYTSRYFTLRVADHFEHKISDTSKVWQMTEWLPKVDDFSKYLLNTEVGIEAAMTKALALRLVGIHRYDSQPAQGRKNYDLSLVTSLAYKF